MASAFQFKDDRERLFGREADIQYLQSCVTRTGLTVITAPPRMGKTWLLREFCRRTCEEDAFFVMEMVWYRMLGPLLGGSTYTFGLILVVALLGIGVGGAAYALGQRSVRPSLAAFALTCGLEALCISVAYALGDRVAVAAALLAGLSAMGFVGKVVGWTLIAGVVILPAAAVSGFQFPLLVGLLGRGHQQVGRHTGLAYAWNTAGAIIGSLAGGFLLLPALTAPGCWRLVVVVLALLGASAAVLAAVRDRARLNLLVPAGAIAGALLLLLSLGPTAAWRHSPIGAGRVNLDSESRNSIRGWLNDQRRAVVWEIDGVESSVAMSDVASLAFILNGKVDGNSRFDAPTQVMLGMVSATLHPNPKSAMVIGLGTGSSAGWMAAVDSIERVDVVELEPGIEEVARRCAAVNRDALANPKLNLIDGDGREVLLTTPSHYDLIASAPSNPYRAGIASLYTVEFYRAVAARLAPGGIFSQWMQAYEVDTETLSMIYATLATVFGSVETWQTNGNDMLFICRMEEQPYPVAELRARLAQEPFRSAALAVWGATDLEGFLSRYVARPLLAQQVAAASLEQGGVNTDDRMQVEYAFARTVGKRRGFSLVDVRLTARRRNEQRPLLTDGEVDWLRVEDNYFLMHLGDRAPVPEAAAVSPDQRFRIRAANRYLSGDLPGVIEAWGQQGRAPLYPAEVSMLAEAFAEAGNEAAFPLAQQLRQWRPADADLILARFHLRRGEPQVALAAMAAAFERLRSDPWSDQLLLERGLALAVELAAVDRGTAVALDRLLAPPFAIKMLNGRRLDVRLQVARRIGCAAEVPVLHELEPYVPWDRALLGRRLTCYDSTGDPLTATAARDFEAFLDQEPQTFDEAVQGATPGAVTP